MDNETALRSKIAPCELPPNLVLEIMARLPVKSLLRFRCVCKAWRHTISDNVAFRGAHLRAQKPRLLVWTSTREDHRNKVTTIGLYVSEESVALADTMDLPHEDDAHFFAHCGGLVLVPMETVVRVVNPATRRVLPLPPSSNSVATDCFYKLLIHQVLGNVN
ncbi:F-box protein At2g40925-like [Aegilops tauschii subsp. strangulata]|uniref:F-box protein At2g40925-like n=1 Tax=Aegilops tauschii subsp. strangulata TaxID=200361 RepID=UPI001ABC2D1D|nr:F-box protein At2g40925-like [Aegilops tauschii subsp. strangulata]